MSQWQPIETAPRDGTEVLVYFNLHGTQIVHIARFRNEREWEASGRHTWRGTLAEWLGWWSYVRNSITQERLDGWHTPTHWMPLPEPPA